MDRYVYDESHLSRTLSFNRSDEGEVNFLVDPKSGYNASTAFEALNRYFSDDFIHQSGTNVTEKGGRGTTLLYTLEYEKAAKLFGPVQDLEMETERARMKARKAQGLQPYMPVPEIKNDLAEQGFGLVMRHYLRGGLVGKFMTDGFFRFDKTACRARLEFELTAKLYRLGLPVPRPLIARERVGSMWIRNDIVVEQLPNTRNLAEILAQDGIRQGQMRKVGQMLRRFFDANLLHTDLNIRNILINDKDECFLIDFDKCEIRKELSKSEELSMLSRLERSFKKEKEHNDYPDLDVDLIMTLIRKSAEKASSTSSDVDSADHDDASDDALIASPAEDKSAEPAAAAADAADAAATADAADAAASADAAAEAAVSDDAVAAEPSADTDVAKNSDAAAAEDSAKAKADGEGSTEPKA